MLKNRSHLLVLAGSGLWCLAIAAAPIFHLHIVYEFFSSICHQQSARSWHVSGSPLPACIRCTSIYFGFFAATLFSIRPTRKGLLLAILASLAEFAIALMFVDSAVLRSLTGFALGATVAPFVRIGIEEMFQARQWKRREIRASV